jgi:mannitol-1-phosphate 5-dehydrogenase
VNTDRQNKLVLFGAGRIGRSFIGQLFSLGGFEVVFIDVVRPVIDELNKKRYYNVIIKAEKEEVIRVENVRGIHAGNVEEIAGEISDARILAVSVGSHGLDSAIPLIAEGLLRRYEAEGEKPLDIIIAENLRNAAEYVQIRLRETLPAWYPLDSLVGLVETSIGKMVPIMTRKDMEEDILQVFAEPYNTLILDKIAFKNPIPEVAGLAPKENMKAWVDRKLFIHNLGHVSAAYCGTRHYPELAYMHEILEHDNVRAFTRAAMRQSSVILDALYPGVFTREHLHAHIEDLISRFRNKALGDTVFRVGCDLQRKLGADDRLLAPFHAGIRLNLPVDKIAEAIFYGTRFRAKDENGNLFKGDAEFFEMIHGKGLKQTLKEICGLDEHEYGILSGQFEKHGNGTF